MNYRSDIKNDWTKTMTFVGIIIFLQFIGSLALTAGRGFENPLFTTRFIIYVLFAVFGLAFIIFAQVKNGSSKKRIFLIPLHEPEEALGVGSLKIFKNPILLLLVTLIIFIPVFFISAKYANTFFSGIPFHTQQVAELSSLWGDAGFPAISENLLMYIPIILLLSANFLLFYRIKIIYWFNNIISIPILMSFIWKAFHNLVYGSNDFAGFYTFMFSYVGVLLTLITMSFILWFVIHFLSNFMLSAKGLGILANDAFIGWLIGAWVFCLLLFFTINYFTKSNGRTVH